MLSCGSRSSDAAAILAAKGRTFHWAAGLLCKRFRERATRLYAFCRMVDDLADERVSYDAARRSLEDCRSAIVSCDASHPTYGDMVDLIRETDIDRSVVIELIDGIVSDLEPARIETAAALLHYCYRVAGTVGIMMCGVLEADQAAAKAHAIDLGIAMQLTNLCRDVAVDAVAGRRYLPASLVGDLDPAELITPCMNLRPRLRDGIETLLRLADDYYSSGERGLAYLPLEARAAILIASQVYRAIGIQLRNRGGDYWSRRVVVSPMGKLTLSASLLVRRPLARDFWVPSPQHDASLHRAFAGSPSVPTSMAFDHGC